ncbi:proline--tRNA ligase [Candidatus Woesearchaeota archaeon]|nr:proline--tRNA ligase [Candidatus Woesearchaeota archaeon]
MAKETQEAITVKKSEDFSEWYQQVVQKAELADYSTVKGCMIIRPNAYYIWQQIQDYFNKRLKSLKVKNAYFPLFIPEKFFQKEAEHAQGFKPEVAWIANTEEGERLAIRPTSETVMYDSYSKWIRSHKDLPLRINQWVNIVRWETKATRLFIRTREFLWQEGHCVYETEKECDKETLIFLREYEKLCKELLALPVITGKKSEKEKFAGAHYTLSIESIMPDGKALQMGTSHNLGQGFARSFKINFLGKDGKEHMPWQNSWGVTTRLIGALAMMHGDDKGLILPPKVAIHKIVLVPILFKDSQEKVLKKAKELEKKLKKYDCLLDDRGGYSAGWKFNEWEVKGIPIRIELGPRDLQKNQVVLIRRDTNHKKEVKISQLDKAIKKTLEDIHNNLYEKARKELESKVVEVDNLVDFRKAIKGDKLVKVFWCGSRDSEEELKELAEGAKSINSPFDQNKKGKCFHCNKESNYWYFAKSY